MVAHLNLAPGPTDFRWASGMTNNGEMYPHWSMSFKRMYASLTEKMQIILNTKNAVLFLTASGTGVVESLISNVCNEGDEIVVLTNGFFGDRLARIAKALSINVLSLECDWQLPINARDVIHYLDTIRMTHNVKAFYMVHLETSTGVLNDLSEVGAYLREHGILFLADAVSSVGTSPFMMDEWLLDGVVTVSYKGLCSPPGLGIISLSRDYILKMKDCHRANYSLGLQRALDKADVHTTVSTPTTNAMILLDKYLENILKTGLESHYSSCHVFANRFRDSLKKAGADFYCNDHLGNCITTINIPELLRSANIVGELEEKYNLYVGAGLGKLAGTVFRLAHYHSLMPEEIDYTISSIGRSIAISN